MPEEVRTIYVQLTFPVEWNKVDFVSGEFPSLEELKSDSELFVKECFLSKNGRDATAATQTIP